MRRHLTLTAATAALLLAAACGSPETEQTANEPTPTEATAEAVPTGEHGEPRGASGAAVDETDAYSVADAVAVASQTVDTRLDRSPADGMRRAAPWLTAELAASVARPMPATGGADWIALADVDGYTRARSIDGDEAERDFTDATQAQIRRVVFITSLDVDGDTVNEQRIGLFVDLTRPDTDAPWRVAGITTR